MACTHKIKSRKEYGFLKQKKMEWKLLCFSVLKIHTLSTTTQLLKNIFD